MQGFEGLSHERARRRSVWTIDASVESDQDSDSAGGLQLCVWRHRRQQGYLAMLVKCVK